MAKCLRIDWKQYKHILKQYSEEGLRYSEIQKNLKDNYGIQVSDQTILEVFKSLGIKYKYSREKKDWKNSEIEELRIYLDKKLSYSELEQPAGVAIGAGALGVGYGIHKALKKKNNDNK